MIQHQTLQTKIGRIVWKTVKRITKILEAKGFSLLPPPFFFYWWDACTLWFISFLPFPEESGVSHPVPCYLEWCYEIKCFVTKVMTRTWPEIKATVTSQSDQTFECQHAKLLPPCKQALTLADSVFQKALSGEVIWSKSC